MAKDRDYTIAAVKRALDVLMLFDREHTQLTLSEISQMSGIGKSSILRILYTLTDSDFLYYSEDTKRYRLGSELYRLGNAEYNSVDLRHIARKHLSKLSSATGLVCYLGVRQGDHMIFLERVMPTSVPVWAQITRQDGGTGGLYSTGIGRLFLAAQTDEEVMAYLDRVELRQFTPNTITDKEKLLEIIRETRRTGIGGNRGENETYVCSICAPVYDVNGELLAGVSLCGLTEVLYSDRYEEYLGMIRDTAMKISREVGYRP